MIVEIGYSAQSSKASHIKYPAPAADPKDTINQNNLSILVLLEDMWESPQMEEFSRYPLTVSILEK